MKGKIETARGTIEVELFETYTPKTVRNFADLAKSGFYSNLVFHRIVKGFVIQTGDPNTRNGTGNRSVWGTGGSDKTIPLEILSSLQNSAGSLGMARSQDPNSGSSQFYINLGNNNTLDGNYTVFGRVTKGMQVVNSIASVAVDRNDAPVSPGEALMKLISIE
jgi:cyclophilin family peptidyl-prolyl cis-trans isomerase